MFVLYALVHFYLIQKQVFDNEAVSVLVGYFAFSRETTMLDSQTAR